MEAEALGELEVVVVAWLAAEVDFQGVEVVAEAVVLQEGVPGQIAEGEVDIEVVLEVVLAADVGVGVDVVVDFEGHNHQIQSFIFLFPFDSAV